MSRSILIIVENAPVPFDSRVWKEAIALYGNGYQVIVLSPRAKGYETRYEVIDGIHVYRHPMPKERGGAVGYLAEYGCALFWEFLYAWWIYLRHGFQVIQGCNPPDDIFLVALPFRLLNVRYIFDHHDANPELYLSKYERPDTFYKILVWLEKLTYRFSDVVMATNASYQRLAITRGRKSPADVFIVRNGPDLNVFKRQPAVAALRHGKRYLVGYVGIMGIQDGLDILLQVAAYIKKLGRRDVHFTCVGGGPALPSLREMVQDQDLGDMVNFTGRVPDDVLLDVLSTADVCVNPDKPCEMNDISTMIKIMEYMALGKPIVQFDLREGRFSAGDASLYADLENQVPDFAAKVLWLLDNSDERERIGRLGRERVEKRLAWEYSVPNLTAAYQRCLNRYARPGDGTAGAAGRNNEYSTQTAGFADDRQTVTRLLADHFRCAGSISEFVLDEKLPRGPGYFRLGSEAVCFGHLSSGAPAKIVTDSLYDARTDTVINGSSVHIPFDPAQVVDNLRHERYPAARGDADRLPANRFLRNLYYAVRPVLGVSVRRHVQRVYFRGWEKIPFPQWPVETSVDNIFEHLLALSMKSKGMTRAPFIWFWPDGTPSCTIVTHDVETSAGLNFCAQLMDLNDSFGIKSSFQIIPEKRYRVSNSTLQNIQDRGFEVNVHDLNHDGHLMRERKEFLRRAERINAYGRRFGAKGFRSAVMYRNIDWFDALEFSYDMSVPNVAHLDPQQGGCCTVFPYFIGDILELPVTTTQDYSLFHVLNDYSTQIWREQMSRIQAKHGLMSFIVHPDYIIDDAPRRVYIELLKLLSDLRSQGETWIALPDDVASWWRLRSRMYLVDIGGEWRIRGNGSERARIAYAVLKNDTLSYEIN